MATDERNVLGKPAAAILDRVEDLSDAQFAYLMLLPALLVLGVTAVWPLVRTFEMSLHADSLTTAQGIGEFVGAKNYVDILTGKRNPLLPRPLIDPGAPFKSALIVTVVFTVVAVSIETVLGFGQALVLDREFTGRRWVRVALILPWTVPIIIQGMIFFLMFQPGVGFAVEPLQDLGLLGSSPLSTSVEALSIVILADVWKQSAFMALLILAGLQSIDRRLYDVADISGASRWQRFKTITFPLVLPTLLVALLFRTVAAMKVYGTIATISNCNVVPSLSCLVVMTFNGGQYGSASTVAFITATIIGVLLTFYIVQYMRSQGGVQ